MGVREMGEKNYLSLEMWTRATNVVGTNHLIRHFPFIVEKIVFAQIKICVCVRARCKCSGHKNEATDGGGGGGNDDDDDNTRQKNMAKCEREAKKML